MRTIFTNIRDIFFSMTSSSEKKMPGDRILEICSGILILYSGVLFIGRILYPARINPYPWIDYIVYPAFSLSFFILFISIRKKKSRGPLPIALLLFYALFCLYPLFFHRGNLSQLVWIMTVPFLSIHILKGRKGVLFAVLFFLVPVWYLRSYEWETILQTAGSFALILVLSMMGEKHLQSVQESYKKKERELSGLLSSQSRFVQLMSEYSESHEFTGHQKINEEEYKILFDTMADILEKRGEFYIFYRKDVLSTIQTIPQADAVLSYILLEGISNIDLFHSDSENRKDHFQDRGNYIFASCTVEDFYSKVESVIDLRKAKKRLEFNKIQTQVTRVFHLGENENRRETNLEEMFEQYNISEREVDVAQCILKGLTNKEISLELYISIETVKTHVKNILRKCKISSRIELIQLFSHTPSGFL